VRLNEVKTLVTSFFSSWRFPTFVIAVVVGYEFLLFALLLLPSGGEFAVEFRTSCFGYDPVTGVVEWIVVFTTFTVPLIVVLVVSISWWRELAAALKIRRKAVAGYLVMGFAIAVAVGTALAAVSGSTDFSELPFPTEALRTEHRAPEFELKDHMGDTVRLTDLRGRVVLVTAIFSKCGYSCPIILRDLQDSIAALTPEQLDDLRIAVITLDPENDTPEVLAKVAAARGFTSPPFHLLSGEPATVERVLDDLAFPRSRDADTGAIDHANLFILIDRQGRVAYRFTLDDRRQLWLVAALRLMLNERKPDK
jgi:protein SCO1/2